MSSCFLVSACLNAEFFFQCCPGYNICIPLCNQFLQLSSWTGIGGFTFTTSSFLWLTIPKHFILIYVLFSCPSLFSGFPEKYQRYSVSRVVAYLTTLSYLEIACIVIKFLANSFVCNAVIPLCSVWYKSPRPADFQCPVTFTVMCLYIFLLQTTAVAFLCRHALKTRTSYVQSTSKFISPLH